MEQQPAGSEALVCPQRETVAHAVIRIKAYITDAGSASPKELKGATGLTNHLVKAALTALVEDHVLVKSGATRSVRYRLETCNPVAD